MALALLTPPGTSVNKFELHVFELAYVLSLMSVETVSGLPAAVMFPKDQSLRKKVLDEGEKRLIAGGLLTPTGAGSGNFSEELLSMTAAIADPRVSILTRRETNQGERSDATIYFNNVEVVEVTQTDRQEFTLKRLADAADAFQRVRKMLGVTPRSIHSDVVHELRVECFEKVRRHALKRESYEAVAELGEAGLSSTAAEDFVEALTTPQRKGTISIMKHVVRKVADVRVMGYYLCGGGAWITSVNEGAKRVRVECVDSEGFVRRLVDRVASVYAV